MSRDIVCVLEIIYVITIYHYIAANEVLQIIIHHNCCHKTTKNHQGQFILFQELFHRNMQAILIVDVSTSNNALS